MEAKNECLCLGDLETPLGPMLARLTPEAVCLLEFTDQSGLDRQISLLEKQLSCPALKRDSPLLSILRTQLAQYFSGTRRSFDLPLCYPGTSFQKKVWEGLLRIPYGETQSYAGLARELGLSPGSARALGRANGENRLSILIPCHRVIAADGSLGGYSGGLWRKKRLLELECIVLRTVTKP